MRENSKDFWSCFYHTQSSENDSSFEYLTPDSDDTDSLHMWFEMENNYIHLLHFLGQCQFFNVKVKHSRKCLNLTLKNWLSVVKLTKQNEFYPNWWRSSPLSEARSRDATDAMIIGGCAPLLKMFRNAIRSGIVRLYVVWFLKCSLIETFLTRPWSIFLRGKTCVLPKISCLQYRF